MVLSTWSRRDGSCCLILAAVRNGVTVAVRRIVHAQGDSPSALV
jgi:hypothetical protein